MLRPMRCATSCAQTCVLLRHLQCMSSSFLTSHPPLYILYSSTLAWEGDWYSLATTISLMMRQVCSLLLIPSSLHPFIPSSLHPFITSSLHHLITSLLHLFIRSTLHQSRTAAVLQLLSIYIILLIFFYSSNSSPPCSIIVLSGV